MSHTVRDAKNNLSSLIRLAEKGEPQIIRRHEKEVAVVVSFSEWQEKSGQRKSLVDILRACPEELDLTRQVDYPRDIDLGD